MLIRGMRNFGKAYERNPTVVNDTEEIIRNTAKIDFVGEDCSVELLQNSPEAIFLEASLEPIPIKSAVKLSRDEDRNHFEIDNIFDAKFFHLESEVKKYFCKAVSINYEGVGYFIQENQKREFSGKQFKEYRLNFSDKLFEMKFQSVEEDIKETFIDQKIVLANNERVSFVFYPYGGFYFYGCHTKQIETCVCRSIVDNRRSLKIKSYTFSSLMNKGKDIRRDTEDYKRVTFAEPPEMSLYDKIKNGECKIKVLKGEDSFDFKSFAVSQIANTNLITIKFIKE